MTSSVRSLGPTGPGRSLGAIVVAALVVALLTACSGGSSKVAGSPAVGAAFVGLLALGAAVALVLAGLLTIRRAS